MLFVTRHSHTDDSCPAGDAKMGPMLLRHLSDENAAKAGVKIQGEAVVSEHTFFMILEAPAMEAVQEFMTPFAQVGGIEILEGNSCEAVVSRGSCGPSGKVWTGGRVA